LNISTDRLLIRQFEKNDIDEFMAYRNNAEWMRFQSFKGLTRSEYERALLQKRSYEDGMQLAVVSRASSTLIGDLYIKKDGGSFWIGYTITPSESRNGYAYEAVQAIIAFLRSSGANYIKAGVDSKNIASISLLKKLDFKFLEEIDDELIFTLSTSSEIQSVRKQLSELPHP
jgi:ribosomal-protein-alanine N-acetyltransferase